MNTYYLYRHIRHDKNEPFYIGIGTVHKETAAKPTFRYRRAYSDSHRNKLWKGVVEKTTYDVEILFETDNQNVIFEKEKEFIKLYGRKDKGDGVLCNLTDGGEGTFNMNPDVKKLISKKNRENGCFERNGKALMEWHKKNGHPAKGKIRPEGYFGYKKQYVYDINGVFLKEFKSLRDACSFYNISSKLAVANRLKSIPANGFFVLNQYKGEKIEVVIKQRGKTVYKIDPTTLEIVATFKSCLEASVDCGYASNTLCININRNIIFKGYIWSYSKTIDLSKYSYGKRDKKSPTYTK